jgi:hypothetical protein
MVKTPSKVTLRKYGLSAEEWEAILASQDGVCAVCKTVPKSNRLNTDHEHVKNWKKLPPEKRKLYVRGLLCYWCNKTYVGRAITIAKAENVVAFLKAYASRRPS